METGLPLFSLITNRMSWLSARQSVISENVANADTPNYTSRDLKPQNFEALLGQQTGSSLNVTNVRHIGLRTGQAGIDPVEARGEASPSGNAVSMEQQMINLSETQIQYQTAANLYQKAVGMFRTALGR